MRTLTLDEITARRQQFDSRFQKGIPFVDDNNTMAQVFFTRTFGIPEKTICAKCGEELPKGEGWSTAVAVENASSSVSAYAVLMHCRDCAPKEVATKLDGIFGGETVQLPANDGWKFIQGEL
jgi:hypothetical protein